MYLCMCTYAKDRPSMVSLASMHARVYMHVHLCQRRTYAHVGMSVCMGACGAVSMCMGACGDEYVHLGVWMGMHVSCGCAWRLVCTAQCRELHTNICTCSWLELTLRRPNPRLVPYG